MRVLDRSRPGIAAQALGIGQAALDYAARYATERHAFGRPIADQQGIQFMLADMATALEAARGLVHRVGAMLDAGSDGPELTKLSAMCKLAASDAAMRVSTDAVQILGGYGYISEFPVERMMRDAKITQIYEGTNQIQRVVIARELLRSLR
jgi:alkylation response protein AidB-like acyl-CoA dehydrogenase